MSTQDQEVLIGALLGDGSMEQKKDTHSPIFCYLSSSKQHVEFVRSYLPHLCTETYKDSCKESKCFDKRTQKTYTRFYFKTKSLKDYKELYSSFYKDKIKVVPRNIEITPLTLLVWYLGDGSINKKHGGITLHTDGFSTSDVAILVEKLEQFNAKIYIKEDKYPLIRIPRYKVKDFLNYIGESPFEDYAYKWMQTVRKNKKIDTEGIKSHKDSFSIIEASYVIGDKTIYQLSKEYSVPIKSIKNYFDNNNVNWTAIDTKKSIIQFKDQEIICEWSSGQEVKRVLGYNASAISECCRGVRKQYKGFQWQFKS